MPVAANEHSQWKAPAADRQTLTWPEPQTLLAETRENHRRLSACDQVRLQGVPICKLRQQLRQFVGHDDSSPLLATGHQTELHHPGVWVKNTLIDAAAQACGGAAYHIAVDTDAPKHLTLRWPDGSMPITDDPAGRQAAWSGALAAPTPAHLADVRRALAAASKPWPFESMLPTMLDAFARQCLEPTNLAVTLTNSLHQLDWSLGLRHHALLASPLFGSETFLVFLHDLLANAMRTAQRYNAALDDYRRAVNATSRMRPMPDLFVSDETVEVPFWLDELTESRRSRPSVFQRDAGYVLTLLSGESFYFDPAADAAEAASALRAWLRRTNVRLAPRALMLTAFLRLLLADQFVHGIGGARYDQVTDRFIASNYGIAPPAYSVTTATLFFPTAIDRTRACVPCVRHEGHQLLHAAMGTTKNALVLQIDALPRRSAERARLFLQMRTALNTAAASSVALASWRTRLAETIEHERADEVLFDRELFYGLQPYQRLADLCEYYRQQFGVAG